MGLARARGAAFEEGFSVPRSFRVILFAWQQCRDRFSLPHDSQGHADPDVTVDVLIKEEPKNTATFPSPSEAIFIEKDDWWRAWEAAGPHISRCLTLPRGPDVRVQPKILEDIMGEIKAEDVEAVGAL